MRRLLSLTVIAGLATISTPALADDSPRTAATRVDPKNTHAEMPSFLRKLLERAGVIEPAPKVHPWIAWWLDAFRIDPDELAKVKTDARPEDKRGKTSPSTTASR